MFVIWNNNEQWFQLGVLFLLFLLLVERATKFIHYFYIFIFIRIKLQLFSLVCGASKRTSESGIRLQVLFWLCKKIRINDIKQASLSLEEKYNDFIRLDDKNMKK